MAPRRITTLLAMPAALRPFVFAPAWTQTRTLEATCRALASYRGMKKPLTVGAFTSPYGPAIPPSKISVDELLESPTPGKSLSADLHRLFLENPATFYDGNKDFRYLKKNTRIPEVCILGRSNVGKSTFVNAIANRTNGKLARTSSKAGHTRQMNLYGFGPAPTIKSLEGTEKGVKRTEDLPQHSLYVVDMPGYGHKSLTEWGKEITSYLKKRASLKGALLLIDGEVGLKDADMMTLRLLREAGLRTAILLTKADKAKDEAMLQKSYETVLKQVLDLQWPGHHRWTCEPDVFVTSMESPNIGSQSANVGRLAIARLAGLVKEKERALLQQPPKTPWTGKVVSFDDLDLSSAPSTEGSVRQAKSIAPKERPQATRSGHAEVTGQETRTAQAPAQSPSTPETQPPNPPISAWDALETATSVGQAKNGAPKKRREATSSGHAEVTENKIRPGQAQAQSPSTTGALPPKPPISAWDALETAARSQNPQKPKTGGPVPDWGAPESAADQTPAPKAKASGKNTKKNARKRERTRKRRSSKSSKSVKTRIAPLDTPATAWTALERAAQNQNPSKRKLGRQQAASFFSTYSRIHTRAIHTSVACLNSEAQEQSQEPRRRIPVDETSDRYKKFNKVLDQFIKNLWAQGHKPHDKVYEIKNGYARKSTPDKPLHPLQIYNPFPRKPRLTHKEVEERRKERDAHLNIYDQRVYKEELLREWQPQLEAKQAEIRVEQDSWATDGHEDSHADRPKKKKQRLGDDDPSKRMDPSAFKKAMMAESEELKKVDRMLKGQKDDEVDVGPSFRGKSKKMARMDRKDRMKAEKKRLQKFKSEIYI